MVHVQRLIKLVSVPLIAVFTKYDLLLTSANRRGGADPKKYAEKMLTDTCIAPFKKYEKNGIPYMTVSSEASFILKFILKLIRFPEERGHEQTLKDLVELTTAEVGKNLPEVAQIVLGVAQQISPKVKIEASIA